MPDIGPGTNEDPGQIDVDVFSKISERDVSNGLDRIEDTGIIHPQINSTKTLLRQFDKFIESFFVPRIE